MAGLADIRKQHPEYNDMPDAALADKLYQKFYSDMPRQEFDAKMGASPGNPYLRGANAAGQGFTNAIAEGVGLLPDKMAAGARAAGLPAPQEPEYYTNAIKGGLRDIGQTATDVVRSPSMATH